MDRTVVRGRMLPLELGGSQAPLWWGMAMLVVIEVVAYATLFTAYLYLRFHTPVWPPAGTPPPNLPIGLAGVVLLLAGAAAVRWAVAGLLSDRGWRVPAGFGTATALAAVFLLLQAVERAMAGFRWDDHAYGSIVWTIGMVHALHVVALVAIGAAVVRLARRGFFSRERRVGLEVLALFWYCIALVWLPVFALVYLVGP